MVEDTKAETEDENVRPTGGRLASGWLALVGFGIATAAGLNATLVEPSFWLYVVFIPIIVFLGATSFLLSGFGIVTGLIAVIWIGFENGPSNALITAAAMFGYFFLIHLVVVQWLWRGTHPEIKSPNVNKLADAALTPDDKMLVATSFSDLNWGPLGEDFPAASVLQHPGGFAPYPPAVLKTIATEFESPAIVRRFYKMVLATDEALESSLGQHLGVSTARLDWSNKGEPRIGRGSVKQMKPFYAALKEADRDLTADLHLKPLVEIDRAGNGKYEAGVRWHLTINRSDGTRLVDKSATILNPGRDVAGGLYVRGLLSEFEQALKDVPSAIEDAISSDATETKPGSAGQSARELGKADADGNG